MHALSIPQIQIYIFFQPILSINDGFIGISPSRGPKEESHVG